MKFGEIPVEDAEGAIIAHSVRLPGGTLRKGRLLDRADIARLRSSNVLRVTAARLEARDLGENEAARRIAEALSSPGLGASDAATGRANLRAEAAGVVTVDTDRIRRLNRVNEAIAVATVAPYEAVARGRVVATAKIVTFGVAAASVEKGIDIAAGPSPAIRLHPFLTKRVGLIQTTLPGLKKDVLDKGSRTTAERLRALGCRLDEERRCSHSRDDIADALRELDGCDVVLVLGASAIVDRRDVVPQAVARAGGAIDHLGMPVDPGHLTLLARIGETAVLGLPGSARSPRLHGFDWILQRLVADIAVTPSDLAEMGVGGLLKEVPGRPMPREPSPAGARVGALLLAAGQSRRMGRVNKMLAEVKGEPMIVHAARALIASKADPVVVVLGHEPDRVRSALEGMNVSFVHNRDFAEGLSTSLRNGLDALPSEANAAVVALGDMPAVTPGDIDALIDAFDPDSGVTICVPTHGGKRGNPVLWARRYFAEMAAVSGDVGARHLIGANADQLVEVPRAGSGVLIDLDTPEALAAHMAESSDDPP